MHFKDSTRDNLLDYLEEQLNHFFPDKRPVRDDLDAHADDALERLGRCIDAVRCWKIDEFDYLHSTQYAIFLYYLANTIWKKEGLRAVENGTCSKLFLLNKALNGIDLFYEIEMPDIFFIGHSVGIVLAKASYENYLVLYQNSTVGKNFGISPVLEEGVVMYPNTAIIGQSLVRKGSIISQGVSVINRDTPGNCLVFSGMGNELVFKSSQKNILTTIFRL